MADTPDTDTESPEIIENSVSTQPPASKPKSGGKVWFGIALIAVAVAVGAILFAVMNKSSTPVKSSSNPTANNSAGAVAQPTNSTPIKTVSTNTAGLNLDLMSISRKNNTLVVNMRFTSTYKDPKSNSSNPTLLADPVYDNKLKDSFVVDDATNMKYEVVTDAHNQPLVSDIGQGINQAYLSSYKIGDHFGFYITVSAPPANATVDISIPGAQTLSAITLK